MNPRPVVDAGPCLNFLATNRERLLIATLGPISAPETVRNEILAKAARDRRFAPAQKVIRRLPDRYFEVLSDVATPELDRAVRRMVDVPLAERLRRRADLGELMVVAHAVVAAESGADVVVVIDDGAGAGLAASQQRWLDRRRIVSPAVGSIQLVNTVAILRAAAGGPYLPTRADMRATYARMRRLDDGLPPIDHTGLIDPGVWSTT